jgi:type I restriction enzyme S subunit
MTNDWPLHRIGDIAERVGMGPFGSSIKVETFVPSGVPVISGQHLWRAKLQDVHYNFIGPEHAQKLKSANVFRGDVIFTHAGSIGQVSYIPDDSQYEKYVLSQRQFFMRCKTDVVLPSYVVYYFKSPQGQHKLLANTSSSGVPSLAQPVTYLRSIEIPVPPLSVQLDIARILGSLDDKIELNRRMNETLEAMAQALFKSWFVDSTQAGLPEDWREGRLGDVAENPRRGVQPDAVAQTTPYIGLEHMPRRCIALSNWGYADEVESNKFEFKRGEILFGKLRPYFHKVEVLGLKCEAS